MKPSVLITGGAGYVGSRLVPQLLAAGHRVVVYDILYFGADALPLDHPSFTLVNGDIRDTASFRKACDDVDMVIHLACISNDPSFDLDEDLSRSINYDAFEPMVIAAKEAGVKRFIYASSSSVYGVSDAPDVTEEHPLVPLTLYNKFKGMCEPLLFKHQDDDFTCVVIRPATVCGYSPRCRLDLTVNILTNHAVNKGAITVFGGSQKRPNLHIADMCDLYELLLSIEAAKIAGETFNVGYQNHTVMDIASKVKKVVEDKGANGETIEIKVTESDDLRSYHVNSDKIRNHLGFAPKYSIEDAISEMCDAFGSGHLPDSFDNDWYFNVRQMQALAAK